MVVCLKTLNRYQYNENSALNLSLIKPHNSVTQNHPHVHTHTTSLYMHTTLCIELPLTF